MIQQSIPFLFICLAIGFMIKYWHLLPDNTYRKVNHIILYFTIPAITLEKISQMELKLEYLTPTISAWLLFLLAGLFFGVLAYFFKWDKKTWAALTLVCGLGNTSFVGYPITKLIFGEEGLKYAIFVDQPGTFACLSTLGIAVAAYASSSQLTAKSMFWRLIKFPAFTCFFIALLLPAKIFTFKLFGNIEPLNILNYIGSWTNPLAFLSIGMQFTFSFKDVNIKQFGWGMAFKLILGPLVFWGIFHLAKLDGLLYDVTILEIAMPPMITASIIASDYGLRPRLSAALINYGIPISAFTLYVWSWVLR
jgi:predicted permease